MDSMSYNRGETNYFGVIMIHVEAWMIIAYALIWAAVAFFIMFIDKGTHN